MQVDAAQLSLQGGGMWVLNIIIGLIMFGVALDLRGKDFALMFRAPKGPLIGLFAQFGLLPAFTYVLTLILQPAPSVALGMLLVASCPGGNLSNFITHFAKGNTALSVTMTAFSTMAAVILTPLNFAFWGSLQTSTADILTEVHLNPLDLFLTIVIILGIPIVLGMSCAHFFPSMARRLHRPFQFFSILAFVTFIVIATIQNIDVFVQYVGWVALAVFIHNSSALLIGYWSAWLGGLPERDRRAISIEVGIQNSALALALAFRYFDGLGGMSLVAGWWGIWHAISGLTLAATWSRRPYPQETHTNPR